MVPLEEHFGDVHRANLGDLQRILSSRSNVDDYVLDDMTSTSLAPASFDAVVAVEVLEHVEADDAFVANVTSTPCAYADASRARPANSVRCRARSPSGGRR